MVGWGRLLGKSLTVLHAASDEQPVFAELMNAYIQGFREFLPIEPDSNGRFVYPELESYWRDPQRIPLLVRVDGVAAGFALLRGGEVWDVAEFFVAHEFRRRGYGTAIAHEVWRRYPGRWQVRVLDQNVGALAFWSCAVQRFTGFQIEPTAVQVGDQAWTVFVFDSK